MRKLLVILSFISFKSFGQFTLPSTFGFNKPQTAVYVFSPRDSAGLLLWLKADTLSLTLANSDPISTWFDASGNVNNATQTLTNRPLFKTNIQNGLPCVRFDGSNDYMNLAGISSTLPFTVFITYKKRTTGVKCPIMVSNTGDDPYVYFEWLDDQYYIMSNGCNYYTGPAGYTTCTTITQLSPSSCSGIKVYANGTEIAATLGGGAGANLQFKYVGARVTDGDYADGDIFEIIFYNHAVTSQLQTDVQNYLRTKYANY